MEKHVRRFAVIDETGVEFELDEFQEFRNVTTKSSVTTEWLPGLKRLQLRGGGAVNFVDQNTFEIVATGKRLTART